MASNIRGAHHCPVLGHDTTACKDTAARGLLQEPKYSVPEAAKILGIGATSMRNLIAEGRLPVLKILRQPLILASDLEAFIQTSRVVLTPAPHACQRPSALPDAVVHSRHLGAPA